MEKWLNRPLRHFSVGSLITLFLSIGSFTCALLCCECVCVCVCVCVLKV